MDLVATVLLLLGIGVLIHPTLMQWLRQRNQISREVRRQQRRVRFIFWEAQQEMTRLNRKSQASEKSWF